MTSAGASSRSSCPFCAGTLSRQQANVPFVLGRNVAIIKDVPAEVCDTCGEAFLAADATDNVTAMLRAARDSNAEVLVVSYRSDASAA